MAGTPGEVFSSRIFALRLMVSGMEHQASAVVLGGLEAC